MVEVDESLVADQVLDLLCAGQGGVEHRSASARAFAVAGARVAATGIDADGLALLGPDVLPVWVDVRDPESVEAMVTRVVEAFGRLDVAHNNAGVAGPYQPLWEYTEAEFAEVLNVDLAGVWWCLKFEARAMLSQDGPAAVVVTSSMLANVGMAGNAVYSARSTPYTG